MALRFALIIVCGLSLAGCVCYKCEITPGFDKLFTKFIPKDPPDDTEKEGETEE